MQTQNKCGRDAIVLPVTCFDCKTVNVRCVWKNEQEGGCHKYSDTKKNYVINTTFTSYMIKSISQKLRASEKKKAEKKAKVE